MFQINRISGAITFDTCVFAYNTSRHESSKYTPFYLMFNRHAILPIDINLTEDSSAEKYHHYFSLNKPDLAATFEHRQEILELAKSNILEAQNKQKAFLTENMLIHNYTQKVSGWILLRRKPEEENLENDT